MGVPPVPAPAPPIAVGSPPAPVPPVEFTVVLPEPPAPVFVWEGASSLPGPEHERSRSDDNARKSKGSESKGREAEEQKGRRMALPCDLSAELTRRQLGHRKSGGKLQDKCSISVCYTIDAAFQPSPGVIYVTCLGCTKRSRVGTHRSRVGRFLHAHQAAHRFDHASDDRAHRTIVGSRGDPRAPCSPS